MCTILFAYEEHPYYDLIIASNRDEFLERPTLQANYWEDYPHILAGRDLEKLGTWLGITTDGRFAALTNYREQIDNKINKQSRGSLVANYLIGTSPPQTYLKTIQNEATPFAGYNLIVGNKEGLYYYSNKGQTSIIKIPKGIHGLSNHLLNTPWPKVSYGKKQLQTIILKDRDKMIEDLFRLLKNNVQYEDHLLPNTGVPLKLERQLSSLFIRNGNYGTKSSTIILRSKQEIIFIERTFAKENPDKFIEKKYEIKLSSKSKNNLKM